MSKGPRPPKPPVPLPPIAPPPWPSTGDGPIGAESLEPCAVPRELKLAGVSAEVGTPVGVILDGADLAVIGGGRRLAVLRGPIADEMLDCLSRRWRFHGEVTHADDGDLTVLIYGAR